MPMTACGLLREKAAELGLLFRRHALEVPSASFPADVVLLTFLFFDDAR